MLATLGFGYGLAVTPLQLAHAYTVFANQGQLPEVSLIRVDAPRKIKSVLKPDVAQAVLQMMESVVEDKRGTGKLARVKHYRIAGKTGTSRLVGPNGYEANHHVASFAGMAPADKPRLVVVVIINDPQAGKYYGGVIAAPLFAKVMGEALRVLGIPQSV